MKFRELEKALGDDARRYLLAAYTKHTIKQSRHFNYNVTPERLRAVLVAVLEHRNELDSEAYKKKVLESINQQVKELTKTGEELKKELGHPL